MSSFEGRVLGTYDPNWEGAFDDLDKALRHFGGQFNAPEALAEEILQKKIEIFYRQFRTAADCESWLRSTKIDDAERLNMRMPEVSGEASIRELVAIYANYRKTMDTVRTVRSVKPEVWGDNVFSDEFETDSSDLSIPGLADALIVTERHEGEPHICVLQKSCTIGKSVVNGAEEIAEVLMDVQSPEKSWTDCAISMLRDRRPHRLHLYLMFADPKHWGRVIPVYHFTVTRNSLSNRIGLHEQPMRNATPKLFDFALSTLPQLTRWMKDWPLTGHTILPPGP